MALDMNNLLTPQVRHTIESMLSTGDPADVARAVTAVAYQKGWNGSLADNPVVEMQKRTAIIRLTEQVVSEVDSGSLKMLADPSVFTMGTTARETDMDLFGFEIDDELLSETDDLADDEDAALFDDADPEDYDESAGVV